MYVLSGCPGNKHKQDRHNCSLMINWKLYLSDLDQWRIQITGSHVPIDAKVPWIIPHGANERLDEDMRDLILECSQKSAHDAEIKELITQKQKFASPRAIPSCLRISRFRKHRYKKSKRIDQNVRKTIELRRSQIIDEAETARGFDDNVGDSVYRIVPVGDSYNTMDVDDQTGANTIVPMEDNTSQIPNTFHGDHETNQWKTANIGDGCIVTYQVGGNAYTDDSSVNQINQGIIHQTLDGQSIAHAFNLPKSNPSVIPVEVIESSTASQMGFVAGTPGNVPVCQTDMELMPLPISQMASLDSGTQQIQLVPHMQPTMNTVPMLVGDSGGQPCYGIGDITFFVCSQDADVQGQ